MIINIAGKEATIKQGTSIEYTVENRLFRGRDGYTLNITFPLKDCPENIAIFGHINRKDVAKKKVSLDCNITFGLTTIEGAVIVTKISEAEVECQFAQGRCAHTAADPFEDVYINRLDLGEAYFSMALYTPIQAWAGYTAGNIGVALPWINTGYPEANNNQVEISGDGITWKQPDTIGDWMLSVQPWLIKVARAICTAVGYSCNFSAWENSRYRDLIMCNTLPASWGDFKIAHTLPEWTVTEFFEKLELFMGCVFDFDNRRKTITMSFISDTYSNIEPVRLDNIIDEYDVEVSAESNSNCEYIGQKRLIYKDTGHEMSKYYSCDWFIDNATKRISYNTIAGALSACKRQTETFEWGWKKVWYNNAGYLIYAKDVDTYFVHRSIGAESVQTDLATGKKTRYTQVYVAQPVNLCGAGCQESETMSDEEVEFVPACVRDTYVTAAHNNGYMLHLSPGDEAYSETDEDGNAYPNISWDDSSIRQPLAASMLESGEETRPTYYDVIYVAFWTDEQLTLSPQPFPIVDHVVITQDWEYIPYPGCSLRLYGDTSYRAAFPKVDPAQKVKFKWLGKSMPNPRAIFHICGKRYVCEKITATITENGMSQLFEGEFWTIIED